MSLLDLPVEILTDILDPFIPPDWYKFPDSRATCVLLRLICKPLDKLISNLAIQKIHLPDLVREVQPKNKAVVEWLLVNIASRDHARSNRALYHLHQWALFMSAQEDWNMNNPNSYNDWLEAACCASVQYKGARWVLSNLICGSARIDTGLPDLNPESSDRLQHASEVPKYSRIIRPSGGVLQLASFRGNVAAVQSILYRGANPDLRHAHFGHALYNAVYVNNVQIIQLLVKNEAYLHARDYFKVLLVLAARKGHAASMRYLLSMITEKDFNQINHALVHACSGGHTETVRAILDWADKRPSPSQRVVAWLKRPVRKETGIPIWNPNILWDDLGTALNLAVKGGHDEVFHMLIVRDDIKPVFGKHRHCPLFVASRNNRGEMMRLLLDHYQLDPNMTSQTNRPLLCDAVSFGSACVFHVLLNRPGVDVNNIGRAEHNNPAAFWLAADRGEEGFVRMLLKRPEIDPNVRFLDDTPMGSALEKGFHDIACLLLDDPRTDPNMESNKSTPLHTAVSEGSIELVRLLLNRPETDPSLGCTSNEYTPFCGATSRGDVEIARELLQRDDVDPNKGTGRDDDRGAPLKMASQAGQVDILELLLARKDIEVNLHRNGVSALSLAVVNEETDSIRLLLGHPDIDPNIHAVIQTPEDGRIEHVRGDEHSPSPFVLRRQRLTPRVTVPPLSIAAEDDIVEAAQLLVQHERTDVNLQDARGRTPLWAACLGGSARLAWLILEHGGRGSVNLADAQGWTPLHVAANYGYMDIVGFLLNVSGIDVNMRAKEEGLIPLELVEGFPWAHTLNDMLREHEI